MSYALEVKAWVSVLGVAFCAAMGCSRQADLEADHGQVCEEVCAQRVECGHPDDAELGSQMECKADCNTPGEGLWETASCDDLAERYLSCLAEISCEEYWEHKEEPSAAPCHEQMLEFSTCWGKEH